MLLLRASEYVSVRSFPGSVARSAIWTSSGGLTGWIILTYLILIPNSAFAQLPFSESFETDGDGTRYTVTDPGFVADTGDAGPAIWGRAAFTSELTAPVSVNEGGVLGLAQGAPEKRAAILWDHTLTEDDVDFDSWSVWLSLMTWATDGKEAARVGFFPAHDPDTLLPTLVGSLGYSIVDIADSANPPPASELDLLIQTNGGDPTPPIAFIDYEVPVIAFNAQNHDDTAITGIGPVLDFTEGTSLTVEDPSHPIFTNPEFAIDGETIGWTVLPATLDGLGKPHGGGTVLATVVNPQSGNTDPALFVIEKGDGLLGTFDPKPDGDIYFAGAALNKFGTGGERRLELNPIDVSGGENVKVSIDLAATDADFEPADYLRVSMDTTGLGEFEVLAEYTGVTAPANIKGALVDNDTGHVLTSNEFQTLEFDVPDGASSVTLRFDALNTWGNEIVGIDDIRIYSEVASAGCDFDGNGSCDIGDLDALLYNGQQSQDAKYDLTGDGVVDSQDRDEWLTQAGVKEMGQAYPQGDFNFSNLTDAADLNILGLSWQSEVNSYSKGDANGDGVVNAADLNVVGLNWQKSGAAASAVPEPSVGWLLIGVGLWCARRYAGNANRTVRAA